jgi:hypothetical protein
MKNLIPLGAKLNQLLNNRHLPKISALNFFLNYVNSPSVTLVTASLPFSSFI